MKLRASNPFRSSLLALATLLTASFAHAADGTWNGITGNWTDTTDPGGVWVGGIPADGIDSTANFIGMDIAADQTITLNGNRTIGNITFTDVITPSNNLTITGNTLTLDRTAGAPVIGVTQANRTLTIASIIAGSDGLQKDGTGQLTLKGTNTFSGGLTIKAGTVTNDNLGSGGNFLGSGTVTIGDSANTGAAANLNFNGGAFTSTNAISVVGNGVATMQVFGWSQTLNGAVTLSNNLTVITNNAFGSSMTFGGSGSIGGTGNLIIQSNAANNANITSNITFSGSGGLNMTGSITNNGTGSSSGSGNVNTTISSVIGTNITGITQNSTNSQLILSGSNSYTSNITVTAGTLSANLTRGVANPTTSALGNPQTAGRTVTVASAGTLNLNVTDVMGNGGSFPVLKFIANGGTIKNTGNTFNVLGPVELNGGTLRSVGGTGSAFPSFALRGTVSVGGSAVSTISNSGTNAQMGLEAGTGTTFDVADAVSGSGSDLNVSAVLANWNSNTGFLIKSGVGTMTLSGVNTYTGGTRIDGGTIALSTSGTIATSAFVTIGASAILDTSAKATYTIPTGIPVNFAINGAASGSTGKIAAAGLNITNATVTYDITGPLDDAVYVLATYTSLTGAYFLSAPVTPAGYTLNYAYEGNKIALVSSGGNLAPSISDIADLSIPASGNTGALSFTITDEDPSSVTPSGTSNNTALVPNANIVFSGTGASRTVTVTPTPGQSGTATITVTLTDNGSLTDDDTFVLTVTDNYTVWQTANSTSQTINQDHDNDGVSNGVEYFISGPVATSGFTPLPGVIDTAGTLSVTWTKAAGYTGVYGTDFVVETSPSLGTGTWANEIASPNVGFTVTFPTANEVKYTFPAGTKNFARLKVTGP